MKLRKDIYRQSPTFLPITKSLFYLLVCKYEHFWSVLKTSCQVFFLLSTEVSLVDTKAYLALYLGGTPSQEASTSPPSWLLLNNHLFMYSIEL